MLPLAFVLSLTLAAAPPLAEEALHLGAVLGERVVLLGESLDPLAERASPAYVAGERAVSNWRQETLRDLKPAPLAALAVALQVERPVVTRCVKLNNYWCIKRARWNGEIGFDEEGHVGFATAEDGANAAAMLLRRYYMEYGRRSALDIVRRWAPAECRPLQARFSTVPTVLAVRGIGTTLRARYLAARRGGLKALKTAAVPAVLAAQPPSAQTTSPPENQPAKAAAAPAPKPARVAARPRPALAAGAAPRSRVSAIPLRPLPTFRVPDIAVGMGERPSVSVTASLAPARPRAAARPKVAPAPARQIPAVQPRPVTRSVRVASLGGSAPPAATPVPAVRPPLALTPPVRPAPALSCTGDEQRLRNYAGRMVASLGLGPMDDLQLFEANGRPLPNLVTVLLAMSAFELGHLGASPALVEAAVERLRLRWEADAVASRPEVVGAPLPRPEARGP